MYLKYAYEQYMWLLKKNTTRFTDTEPGWDFDV